MRFAFQTKLCPVHPKIYDFILHCVSLGYQQMCAKVWSYHDISFRTTCAALRLTWCLYEQVPGEFFVRMDSICCCRDVDYLAVVLGNHHLWFKHKYKLFSLDNKYMDYFCYYPAWYMSCFRRRLGGGAQMNRRNVYSTQENNIKGAYDVREVCGGVPA